MSEINKPIELNEDSLDSPPEDILDDEKISEEKELLLLAESPVKENPEEIHEQPDPTQAYSEPPTSIEVIPPAPSTSNQPPTIVSDKSRKRKSQHVAIPMSQNDFTFEESIEVIWNDNNELMEYLSFLRVTLNDLLTGLDLEPIKLPGATSKVKIFEKVFQMLRTRMEESS